MNFFFKEIPYSINCDWLQYSVKTKELEPELICPDGYRIEIAQGNNIFKNRAMVFTLDGRKFLTLLWCPYSKVLDQQIMTVQVANEFLYNQSITKSFEVVRKIVDCNFNAIGRFDVCCDFEINERQLNFLKHLNSGHYYVQRKGEGSVWWHEVDKEGFKKKQLHCLAFGSQKSEIKVKIYNKSREQGLLNPAKPDENGVVKEPEPEKPWIVKNWEELGMDKKAVWRIEFSLSGAGELEWNRQKISLENIESPSWLVRCFFDLYKERFITRINQGKKHDHKNDDSRVYLLSLPVDGEHLTWKEPLEDAIESKPATKLLRSMMRNLDNEVLNCSKPIFESYAKSIINLVENANLGNYFRYLFEDDVLSYFEKKYETIGEGIQTVSLPPSRFIN